MSQPQNSDGIKTSEEPPHAKEVEKRLLGVAIMSEDAAHDMIEVLEGEHSKFYSGRHQRIAYAIMSLIDQGDPVDLMTVTQRLRKMGELENAGGSYYITDLTSKKGLDSNAKKYSRIIVEQWIKRRVIELGINIVRDAQDDTTDAFEVLKESQEEMLKVGVGDDTDAGRIKNTAKGRVEQHVESTRLRRSGQSPLTGIPTPFDRVNDLTGGWGDEELIILAARPSMGKSAWALADAIESAQEGYKTAIFSFEMGQSEWFDRGMGYVGEVNMQKVGRGYGSDDDLRDMYRAAQAIEDLPLWVIDDPGLTISGIRAKARRLVKTEGVEQIFVDYLQLVGASGSFGTREQEVAYISRQLKIMAMDLEVPVIALSQLNRKSLSRGGGKRPSLSDLRESGALEQDADVVAFIHRPERLGIEQHDELGVPSDGLADLIVSKQRNGPVGTVYMRFVEEYAKFEPIDIGQEFGDTEMEEDDQYKGSTPKASIPQWAHKYLDDEIKEEQASHKVGPSGDGAQQDLMDDDGPSAPTPSAPPGSSGGDSAPADNEIPDADELGVTSDSALDTSAGRPDNEEEEDPLEDIGGERGDDGPNMDEDDEMPF